MLVTAIERAIEDDRLTTLAQTMAQLSESGALNQPGLFASPKSQHYVRRLIKRDPHDRFIIVGMTWAPGQCSMLHNHGGVWGAEIVVSGVMRESAYRLVDRDMRGRYRFMYERERILEPSSVGALAPPHDYHVFGNAGSGTAYTLHVYIGSMTKSTSFVADDDGWWNAREMRLSYDA